mgnify:CR=1 FL=1
MKSKQVYPLSEPAHDPFLVKLPSDLEEQMLAKYAYLERQEYLAYRRKERRAVIGIIIMVLLLIGALVLLVTTDANTIDNFFSFMLPPFYLNQMA